MGQSKPIQPQSGFAKDDQDLDHIQELAKTLVRHLGVQGARRICQENHWKSVLVLVERAQ